MARKSISDSLSILKEQKIEYKSFINSYPLKDHLKSIKIGLQFLDAVFGISDDENLDLQIEGVMNNVLVELRSLSNKPTHGNLVLYLDHGYTNLREMMKDDIINPETREYSVVYLTFFRRVRYFDYLANFVREGIRNLARYQADLLSPLAKEKLWFLEALLAYITDLSEHISKGKELRATSEVSLAKSVCLFYTCLLGKMDKEMELTIFHNLSDLLEKNKVKEIYIAFYRTSKKLESPGNLLENEIDHLDSLINILESNTSFVVHLNDLIMKLHDKLKFLKQFVADLPHEVIVEKFTYLVTSIEAIISGTVPIINSNYDEDMKEEMSSEAKGLVLQLLDQIEKIQVAVGEMKLYNYPQTNELGFLDLFLEHLEELLNSRTEFVEILKNEIGELHVAFDSLRSFLRKIRNLRYNHEELEGLWTRTIGLAYQAEYIIDFFLVKKASDYRILFSISNVIRQAKLIMSEVEGIDDLEKYHTRAHGVPMSSDQLPSKTTETTTDKVVVGFEDEAEKIRGYLLGESKERDVISICGMPGLGKTTLAKKMYEDPFLIKHFQVRAWCTVSQTYQKDNLLLSILGNIVACPDQMKTLEGLDEDEQLKKLLMGRRYFIVLDDIWDINVWNDLVRSLPDGNNRSRILVTSRLHNVASQIKAGSKVHCLRPLSIVENWDLFQKLLFNEESFSQEFLDVGKQIAESCKGLPLAIVVATGILASLERNIDMWKQIARSLSSHMFSDSETHCMDIFEPSYKNLPDHLKSCFLYIGAFIEGAEISFRKLKWLWIAEGFVRDNEAKSAEDVAEEYLMELISRSLVTVTKESSQGGAKACGIHDIFRFFILEKVKKESFLQVVGEGDSAGISAVYDLRRISFYCHRDDLIEANPYSWSVRSLFISSSDNHDMSFTYQNFMLLRVLDLGYLHINKTSFGGITLLIHLRYLAFGFRSLFLPSSIDNLSNLQCLHVRNLKRGRIIIPDSLWNMVNLRNVKIDNDAYFYAQYSRCVTSYFMQNLLTLSLPCFNSQEDAENLLRMLPKLQRLKCVFLDGSCRYLRLGFLKELLSLKVDFMGVDYLTRCVFKFPSNLQKLTLSNFNLSGGDISNIGRELPNLKVLKLINSYWKWEWTVEKGDFPNLKYLKLSNMTYMYDWNASEDSFPMLEQLVLDNLGRLSMIPRCFEDVFTLLTITVRDCEPNLDDSVRRVHEEQLEGWQNIDLKVSIYPRIYKATPRFATNVRL